MKVTIYFMQKNKDRYYTQNKYINTLYSIADKLEQRIAKLEKVLESHAKCIGEMRDKKDDR